MGYLEVEDRRIRDYLKDEIIEAVMRFSENERKDEERFVSLDGSSDDCAKKEIGRLSDMDDCSVSFFENNANSILDVLESEDLTEAVKYLKESEIDLLTRLYVKQQEEYEIARELNTTVDTIQFRKKQIFDKIKQNFKF